MRTGETLEEGKVDKIHTGGSIEEELYRSATTGP